MTGTRDEALEHWSTAELVAFHAAATESLVLCDDGHEPLVEPAGLGCVNRHLWEDS